MMALETITVVLNRQFSKSMRLSMWEWLNDPAEANFSDFRDTNTFYEFDLELKRRIQTEHIAQILLEDQFIGFMGLVVHNPVCVQFHGVVLDPKFRRLGLGSEAINYIVKSCSEAGVRTFMAPIFSDNIPIRRTLKNCGFHCIGTIPYAAERNGNKLDMIMMVRSQEGSN